MNTVIIVGGSLNGLGIIRILGRYGYQCILINTAKNNQGPYSKYCKKSYNYYYNDDPKGEKLIEFLLDNKKLYSNSLIIPDNDNSALILSKNKSKLSKYYKILVANISALKICNDKKLTFETARKIGVPFPITIYPKKEADLNHKSLRYPCIMKPRECYFFKKKYNKKAFLIKDKKELLSKFKQVSKDNFSVGVSEIIPGNYQTMYQITFYISQKGNFNASCLTHKIREAPPLFGTGCVVRTIKMIPEIEKLTKIYTKKIGYKGIGMIEFKYDYNDKKYKILDFNPRPIIFQNLFKKAGIDLLYLATLDYFDNKELEIKEYKTNVYWINLLGDIYYYLLKKNTSLKEYIKPYFKKKVFDCFVISDIKPFLHQIKYYITK